MSKRITRIWGSYESNFANEYHFSYDCQQYSQIVIVAEIHEFGVSWITRFAEDDEFLEMRRKSVILREGGDPVQNYDETLCAYMIPQRSKHGFDITINKLTPNSC